MKQIFLQQHAIAVFGAARDQRDQVELGIYWMSSVSIFFFFGKHDNEYWKKRVRVKLFKVSIAIRIKGKGKL